MNLSEFIERLQGLFRRYGDIPIYYLEDHERDENGDFKQYDIFIEFRENSGGSNKKLLIAAFDYDDKHNFHPS